MSIVSRFLAYTDSRLWTCAGFICAARLEVTMRRDEKISQAEALTRREFIAGAVLLGAAGTALHLEAALPVVGIDHVNIHVPDVQRSADFYIKLSGVEVSRAPNAKAQTANPASPSGVLWFIRLGRSNLAISPLPAGEGPGLDHFSFGITGFNGEAVKSQLAGLNQQWPDSPSNNLWLKDPVGRVIQLNAPGDPSRVPGAGVGAVLVEPVGGVTRQPAFQATRITLLTMAVRQLEPSATYYRNLLGAQNEQPQKGRFRVGESEFVLGPASAGDYFRIGVAGFDPAAAVTKLKSLGVKANVTRDKSAVSFRDLDGIQVQIGGDSATTPSSQRIRIGAG
ncbi:MAG: hypothetical protein DMG13_07905 [Acidobacteria bacterium]|nr:MAG: hypothetical protein DMG13_07905 [Acidobacteriota bacterium]